MIKNNLKILIIILFSLALFSCQTLNDSLGGKKRSNQSDEFLVEKKNPLAMPPDFKKLPTPGSEKTESEINSNNNDEVKDLLNIEKIESTKNENNENSTSIENSIIEKIQ